MAITRLQAVERAYFRIHRKGMEVEHHKIDSVQDDALALVADRCAQGLLPNVDPSVVHKLTTNIALTSGRANLDASLMVKTIPEMGTVTVNGSGVTGRPAEFCPTLTDLFSGGRSDQYEHYTIAGGSSVGGAIHVRKWDGTTIGTSVDIYCGVYPTKPGTAAGTYTNLSEQLEEDFIDCLVEVAMERFGVGVEKQSS